MQIELLHRITLSDTIITATIANANEVVMHTNCGEVVKYKIKEQFCEPLFPVKSSMGYSDGGFDISAPSSIYTLDDIVVIVNDFKRHGWIHYPGKYNHLHLWRGDYHAEISRYPIALYKNNEGIPHIIYAADWNHLQIMNLDTRQILTAAKSLIEENAEEKHIEFYKTHTEHNKLTWPSRYDYFFGKLQVSPNCKMFLSAGWAWGSCDAVKAYDLDHFINSNRIADIAVYYGEHNNRYACWINENTIAIPQNPYEEESEGATKETPNEILYYKINGNKAELEHKVTVGNLNIVTAEIAYNKQLNALIAFSEETGVAIIALSGEILFHDSNLKMNSYNAELNMFHKIEGDSIALYKLIVDN